MKAVRIIYFFMYLDKISIFLYTEEYFNGHESVRKLVFNGSLEHRSAVTTLELKTI